MEAQTYSSAGLKKELLVTRDGSHTVVIPSLDISYRSRHGAVQESTHVFINAGLHYQWAQQPHTDLTIFEVGFGTGLNALLTCNEAAKAKRKVYYTTIEPDPLDSSMTSSLNFSDEQSYLSQMHNVPWGKQIAIHPYFVFTKYMSTLDQYHTTDASYDVVFYDAFSPLMQPGLWTSSSFEKILLMMNKAAVLTTYCSKSEVRRTMMKVGLQVHKIPGPYGKREMVRAVKAIN